MQAKYPFFSVILPTKDRPQQVAACISSLCRLHYPKDRFEVIVVNDGGEPPCASTSPFSSYLDLTLISRPNGGAASARNDGAAQARGELLAFVDDDCTVDPAWLRALAIDLGRRSHCMVGGRTINGLPTKLFSNASQLLVDFVYSVYNSDPLHARFFASNNIAVAAKDFQAVGTFDKDFNVAAEDRELCRRWLDNGYEMRYACDAIIYHQHHLTFRSFLVQHLNYGRGAFCYHKAESLKHPTQPTFQPLFFYLKMLLYPLRHSPVPLRCWIACLFVLSQVASAYGFFLQMRQKSVGANTRDIDLRAFL